MITKRKGADGVKNRPSNKSKTADGSITRHAPWFVTANLAIPTISFFVFTVYLTIQMVVLSFQTMTIDGWAFCGFKNYVGTMKDFFIPGYESNMALINSLKIWVWHMITTYPFAIFMSYVFFKKMPGNFAFRIIYMLPMVVPISVMTMVFTWALDPSIGFIHNALSAIGIHQPVESGGWLGNDSAFNTVMVYAFWSGAGGQVLYFAGNMSRIPGEVIESARLDGVGFWRELFQIVLPLIAPIINTLLVLNVGTVTGFWLPSSLLTNGGAKGYMAKTIAYKIMDTAYGSNAGLSSAMGVSFSLIMMPIVMGFRKLMDKLLPGVEY
ncbi:MAG: sugar ABC transporter permease [Clostridia bacterium]|nr:sugar ABC transporter permease [Clostridia bacterium]